MYIWVYWKDSALLIVEFYAAYILLITLLFFIFTFWWFKSRFFLNWNKKYNFIAEPYPREHKFYWTKDDCYSSQSFFYTFEEYFFIWCVGFAFWFYLIDDFYNDILWMYLNTRFEGIGTQGRSFLITKDLYPNKRIWAFKRSGPDSAYIVEEVQYPYNLSLTRPEIVTSNETSKTKRKRIRPALGLNFKEYTYSEPKPHIRRVADWKRPIYGMKGFGGAPMWKRPHFFEFVFATKPR